MIEDRKIVIEVKERQNMTSNAVLAQKNHHSI